MNDNDYSEMWAEFCFLLSENINPAFSEKDFENQVVRSLEVLGWREFKHEIERQPTIQLGREGTLRPDLIIYGNDKKALIVIEVKRPSEDIARDNIIGQLRSYMRQMKSDFGFLMGVDLRVYYDGPSNPHPDPILLERIEFERNSKEGIKFFELFNKQSFLNGAYQEYLEAKIRKFNKKREVKSIIDKILSFETKQRIISYLRNDFSDIGDETFLEAIEQINIDISIKANNAQPPERPEIKQTRPPKRGFIPLPQDQEGNIAVVEAARIATIPFSRIVAKLRQIYGVLYFMKQGFDFPSATHKTLGLFPEVRDYQTISDKCGRGFAGNVDTFVTWFNTGQMLNKLKEKLNLSDHDYNIFRQLLSTKAYDDT
jgi:hypothetical protein